MPGADENLSKIDHVVVLMLENRSFDHMLGYLSLTGGRTDIDGLTGDECNFDPNNVAHDVHHLTSTVFSPDPCHEPPCVAAQLEGDNGGFVKSFGARDPISPERIMGHFNGDDLPTYDFLADQYCVCDRWFSSYPGDTFPNRLYALCGTTDGITQGQTLPLYEGRSFVRHLDANGVSWKWYRHELEFSMLGLCDEQYRFPVGDHFAMIEHFGDDAARGALPAVSWIDPSFFNAGLFDRACANDDHPEADVIHAQMLVYRIYSALRASPTWPRTLLLITYDEHGGFYDHVPPPVAAPPEPSRPQFNRYGVRVPALIVSPWVEPRSVSSQIFDHTSIIKTILARFCRAADGSLPDMGARVAQASHLGTLLGRDAPRPLDEHTVFSQLASRMGDRAQALAQAQAQLPAPAARPLTNLQQGLDRVRTTLRQSPPPSQADGSDGSRARP